MKQLLTRWLDVPVPAAMDGNYQSRRYFRMLLLMIPAAAFFHACFIGLFAWLGSSEMAWFNVASTVYWIACGFRHRRSASNWLFASMMIEIVAHAICASFAVGWGAGFHVYLVIIGLTVGIVDGAPLRAVALIGAGGGWLGAYVASIDHVPWTTLPETTVHVLGVLNFLSSFGLLACFGYAVSRAANQAERLIAAEHQRSEALLHNILPPPIAERLKGSTDVIADGFDEASVLFSDIVGFTALSARVTPAELVAMLNDVFTRIDALVQRYGLEKIKTIGDAYMVASGLPVAKDDHVTALTRFALDMVDVLDDLRDRSGAKLQMRIGIHTGPVVAGVIGRQKFAYDLWGDTVNTAARMESHGRPGQVHVSEAVAQHLGDEFQLEERGVIDVKGKGQMRTFFVSRRESPSP